ncbi:MAG: proteasome subunit beta [Acidimicrobiia bacterium]|nr:proteasome subunit beta [Acidimicrobiia bacterium]
MTLPSFSPGDDPGPSFTGLLARLDVPYGVPAVPAAGSSVGSAGPGHGLDLPHGTTVVASKFADGVIMAGDRRATSGNLIAHRTMRKVFAADRWSGVAIAGAAGPALDMVKLFQLQLQHYEKVEGHALSLEGKANQLSQMLKGNLAAAMQGMVVVPIFAGFDRHRGYGRLFAYDVTGGRYEEEDFVASGSGSLFARTAIKLGYAETNTRDQAVDLLIRALFTAADDDSATGGPDAVRRIYPIVAVITERGYEELTDDEVAARFEVVLAEHASRSNGGTAGGSSAS